MFISYDKKSKEKGKGDRFIELKGVSQKDQPIVHFLEQLRAFPYIDAVVLHESSRKWIEKVPVQEFSIYFHFLKPESAA